jgi:hypothetical protein
MEKQWSLCHFADILSNRGNRMGNLERPLLGDCVEEVGVWRGDNRRLVCAESR